MHPPAIASSSITGLALCDKPDSTNHVPVLFWSTMANHSEGVNPLRPYYIPPTIGEPLESLPTPGPHAFSHTNATGNYASKARDIFSDIDYKDYIADSSPSLVQSAKELVDELLWKYTSVLLAQPFEVAKTILQVRTQDDVGGLAAAEAAAEELRQMQATQKMSGYEEVCLSGLGSSTKPTQANTTLCCSPQIPTQSSMRCHTLPRTFPGHHRHPIPARKNHDSRAPHSHPEYRRQHTPRHISCSSEQTTQSSRSLPSYGRRKGPGGYGRAPMQHLSTRCYSRCSKIGLGAC